MQYQVWFHILWDMCGISQATECFVLKENTFSFNFNIFKCRAIKSRRKSLTPTAWCDYQLSSRKREKTEG